MMGPSLVQPPDDLAGSMERLLELIPRAGSAEEHEVLGREVHAAIRSSTIEELRQARARIIDWLRHHESWIRENPERAISSKAVQETLIRGEMIHAAIRTGHRGPGWLVRVCGRAGGESRIKLLTHIDRDWQSTATSPPT